MSRDQSLVVEELLFEVAGSPDARSETLARDVADQLAARLRDIQERRLSASPDAPAIHIEQLRVPLPGDPAAWPPAAELARRLTEAVVGHIEGWTA